MVGLNSIGGEIKANLAGTSLSDLYLYSYMNNTGLHDLRCRDYTFELRYGKP